MGVAGTKKFLGNIIEGQTKYYKSYQTLKSCHCSLRLDLQMKKVMVECVKINNLQKEGHAYMVGNDYLAMDCINVLE